MQTHYQSSSYSNSSVLQPESPEEEEKLRGETAPKVEESRKGDSLHQNEEGIQFKGINWCYKLLYILILIGLTASIATEFLLRHQTRIKNTNKFLKNLDELKKEAHHSKQDQLSSSNQSMKKLSNLQDVEKQNLKQKQDASQGISKPQQKQLKKQMVNAFEIKASEETKTNGQAKKGVTPTQQAKTKNPLRPVLNPTPKSHVVGSGINQTMLIKARLRRTLVHLPFNQTNEVSQEEFAYYQDKYHISSHPELPFCIVVPTYNNAKNGRFLNNIRSIVMQNYTNYHLVVIDDASTDDTGQLILNFLRTQEVLPRSRYEIIRNSQQMRAMHNLRFAAKTYCKPNDIFLIVDGDDELLGRQVLKLFSAKFQTDGLYFMYTNFLSMAGRAGYSRPFPQRIISGNAYRKYPFVTSHLRAFYTQLFLNIKDEDLQDDKGEFFRAANDVAICIPILEQAHQRVEYVPELTYFYNSNTGLNNHALRLKEQRSNDKKVRTRRSYMEVLNLFEEK